MISWKINIRHETCVVIFFITMLGIFALECPTNECHCHLTNDKLTATIRCITNSNSEFYIHIEQNIFIMIHCFDSPEWSDFDLNMTSLGSYELITFDNCSLPSNNSLSDIAHMLGATSVEKLNVFSYNKYKLTLKKHHLNGFNNLTHLYLFNNNLHHLTVEFFDYTTQLMYLYLRGNKLKLIASGTFDTLNNLLHLDLSNNHLTKLELGIFDKLIALLLLKLSYNYLVTLPKDIFAKLKNLSYLYLNANDFTYFPRNLLQNNKNLTVVDMSSNRNLFLWNGFFSNMVKLRYLKLQDNGLIALPEDLIWRSFQLHFINLSENYLQSLPKHVFRDAINLKILILKSNNMKVLSDYIFENTSLLMLDLSNNRFTSISRKLFNGLHALEELNMEQNYLKTISFESFSSLKSLKVAKFSNNYLTLQSTLFYPNIVPKSPFHNCPSLKELYLSHNNISQIILNGLSRSIEILELHSNKISKIRPDVLEFFQNSTTLTYLTLHDNPWECNCDAVDFLYFIHTEYRKIHNIPEVSQVMCHGTNKSVSDMTFYDFCPFTTVIIRIGVLITLIGFNICILGLCYKYNKKYNKKWLIAHEWYIRFVTEKQLNEEELYDAFVSYSHKDHNFIINELVPKLENGPTPYKLCLHYRDCSINESISDIIARSVQKSRRTIVILSPNFLDSVWGKMEFRVAYCQALSEGRAKMILILYDDIGLLDDLDAELKAIITMSTCIQWSDPLFWDKLRYELPHQSTRPESCIVEKEVVEDNEL
ncbi:protein toll-like [Linepithema humile]|uniref:protein toll-like n=1 Tax=Linepithema humile TaxID=83485 RepID=UPI000623B361|nr:PREDICTED: protein toll-like [Linepithema humile]XP_012215725.1 PREDICTED: protein toll-like [Linepithema humile]XP_012215726.1 PREDICTED: protein toll-like [Linepithema humile]